ncbi:MAG: hypothetical protein H5T86_11780 [Armatimonadetes bacterium]|nr:hypothetical protein [Armatimonadota bacterium]
MSTPLILRGVSLLRVAPSASPSSGAASILKFYAAYRYCERQHLIFPVLRGRALGLKSSILVTK